MERILKTIAKQANLDRVLFTPALKKLYFSMAIASGGATQFKHADSIRKGISYAADKADDKKHVLLFCSVTELIQAYDLLLHYAESMLPLVVLAMRAGTDDHPSSNWSFHELAGTGWMQFHTHTRQELYDHLALAYHLFEEKKVSLPALVIHSSPDHPSLGEFAERKDMNLGNPLTGLNSSRTKKKMDFDSALKALKQKKEKPSLRATYTKIPSLLQEIYERMGYQEMPFAGEIEDCKTAILTSVPPANTNAQCTRLLCYRPLLVDALRPKLLKTERLVIVEPMPSPGVAIPPYYAEITSALHGDYQGQTLSVCTNSQTALLSDSQVDQIVTMLQTSDAEQFQTV